MVDLGQKGRKKFRLFYWNNFSKILKISYLSDIIDFYLKCLGKKTHNNIFELPYDYRLRLWYIRGKKRKKFRFFFWKLNCKIKPD